MLSLLIELQSHVETIEEAEARQLDDAIWRELEDYTKRREFTTWDLAASMVMPSEQD